MAAPSASTAPLSAPRENDKPKKTSRSQHTLWLCLHFPELPLHALGVRTDDPNQHCAVIENHRIIALTKTLQCNGVQRGMSVSQSRMLLSDTNYLERKPATEQSYLEQLAHWAYHYSPLIKPYQQSLLIDIGGCLRLFGSFHHLYQLINADLETLGVETSVGVACTPTAAYILSKEKNNGLQEALSGKFSPQSSLHSLSQASLLSLDTLVISKKTIDQLQACGFEYLQDIIDIPARELGERFGFELPDYLDRMLGIKPDPQTGIVPPETFFKEHDFSEPVHNQQWISSVVSELLQQLCHFLRRRQLHCQGFDWYFYNDKNQLLEKASIALATKKNHHELFKQLTELQLEKINLRNELMRIELSSTQLLPMSLLADDFFNPSTEKEEALQLIDKLKARLGKNAVFQLHISPEHLPELRNRRQPIINGAAPSSIKNTQTLPAEQIHSQPIWLLPTPQQLNSNQLGQPCTTSNTATTNTPLNIIHGPDRITSHWWRSYQRRDYFIARHKDGRLLWIFYDLNKKTWFLQGFFG